MRLEGLLQAALLAVAAASTAPTVKIQVDPSVQAGSCTKQATGFACADLHAALKQAADKSLANSAVTVSFSGTLTDGPYKVAAPGGEGSLVVDGGGKAVIDGRKNSTLMAIGGGAVTISGITFLNGYVPAQHAPKGAAAVSAQAHTMIFEDCTFQGNRGFDGGAVLAYHNELSFVRCHFKDNQGYGGELAR